MTDAYAEFKMTKEKRDALVGKTIASVDVADGDSFGTSFNITFTDGTSVCIGTEGYEGVSIITEGED